MQIRATPLGAGLPSPVILLFNRPMRSDTKSKQSTDQLQL